MADAPMINVSVDGAVALLTLDRQERRNALNTEQCGNISREVTSAVAAGARAIVLTGAGTSFCSGADFGEVYGDGFRDALYGMLHDVAEAPVPVIAAVNGPAIGAGLQLAIACDLRIADSSAVFGLPTAKLGLAVDPWTIRRLALIAGEGAARTLLLACSTIDAELAHSRGLVDRLGTLEDALGWAKEIAGLAPLTLRYYKQALNHVGGSDLADPELLAAFETCWASEDLEEGRRARHEKRTPNFQGR
jgi:enoyl-CoA hydratase/carnithine racemase